MAEIVSESGSSSTDLAIVKNALCDLMDQGLIKLKDEPQATTTDTECFVPVLGYVHKETSLGILLGNGRDIVKRMSKCFRFPVLEFYEQEAKPLGTWFSRFYEVHFNEKNVNFLKSQTSEIRKQLHEQMFWGSPEEDSELQGIEVEDLVLTEKDLVPVTVTDLMVLYNILKASQEICTPQNADTFCTAGVLGKFLPQCPEKYQNMELTWKRLINMVRGIYFVTWRPKYEGMVFLREDGDMMNALIPTSLYSKMDFVCLSAGKITRTYLQKNRESDAQGKQKQEQTQISVRLSILGVQTFCANMCMLMGECRKDWDDCSGEYI